MNKPSHIDFNSVIGILLALIAIIAGQMLEGGHIGSLLQGAAFVIVVGGTVGAVLLQSPVRIFLNGVKMGAWVFFPPAVSSRAVIKQILLWSEISRKEGLLALESYVQIAKDPLAKKGLQLLADGSQPDK